MRPRILGKYNIFAFIIKGTGILNIQQSLHDGIEIAGTKKRSGMAVGIPKLSAMQTS